MTPPVPPPDVTAGLRALLKMVICPHENRAGGNDYILCADCNLMWDYRREKPKDVLHMLIEAALQGQPSEPEGRPHRGQKKKQ